MDQRMQGAVDSGEIRNVAKQLQIQFAHYMEQWDEMSNEAKRPYIRAATILVAARNKSQLENS